jgi:multiple sugar transport system ATP-binding protein
MFVGSIQLGVGAPELAAATLAVRPEHVRIGAADGAASATVIVVESLGPETLVHLQFEGGDGAVARVAGAYSLPIGSVVPVSIDPRHALVFDPGGKLVWHGAR